MGAKEKVNILMVDDQPAKLLSHESILDELGENLLKANSGREALELLLKNDIAVMLMDVSMPELDGFELAEMIRQHPRFQKTAIIFISAVHLTDLDRLKGYERGAVDYISVPVIPELLRAKVSVFAELHRRARQLESLNRELEQRAAELKAAEESLRRLSGRLMRSQDDERRRIARELHDGLGQYLVAVKMNLESVNSVLAGDPKVTEYLADATKQVTTAIKEARTMSYLLHPPLLDDIGLKSALTWYAEGYATRSGLSVDVQISPALGRLATEAETALFRVVQECLANIHRHSGSSTASIRLIRDSGEIRLEVRDQGKGMPHLQPVDDSEPATLGIGIQGMRERIRQLQGRMNIISEEGRGTAVVVIIPDTFAAEPSSGDSPQELKTCETEAS